MTRKKQHSIWIALLRPERWHLDEEYCKVQLSKIQIGTDMVTETVTY